MSISRVHDWIEWDAYRSNFPEAGMLCCAWLRIRGYGLHLSLIDRDRWHRTFSERVKAYRCLYIGPLRIKVLRP